MFENLLKYNRDNSILIIRNFDRVLAGNGGLHMMNNSDCKKQKDINIIVELLQEESHEKVREILVFVENYLKK